jgi:hypothetical protein
MMVTLPCSALAKRGAGRPSPPDFGRVLAAQSKALVLHDMDAAAKARVEAGRNTWSGGKVKLAEAEIVDEQFWQSMTPEERFLSNRSGMDGWNGRA